MGRPFVEQGNLYQQYDLESDWKSANNAELAKSALPILRCPSSNGNFDQFGSFEGAVSDYAMSKGPAASLIRKDVYPTKQLGMFDINSATTFAQIRDGASNVLLIGEAISDKGVECRSL